MLRVGDIRFYLLFTAAETDFKRRLGFVVQMALPTTHTAHMASPLANGIPSAMQATY